MARSFAAAYVAPDPADCVPRRPITAAQALALAEANNHVQAAGKLALCQAWNSVDAPFARTPAAWSASPQAVYRIPRLGARTDLGAAVYVSSIPAGGGIFKVTSVATGLSVAVGIAPGAARWVLLPAYLTVDCSAGYDDIEVRTQGDGTDPLVVDSIWAEHAPLSSPLAAGPSGAAIPLDSGEVAADQPLSADLLVDLTDTLTEVLSRPRSMWSWSGLTDVDDAAAGTPTMPAWSHRGWTIPLYGARDDLLAARIWVQASNPGGSDEYVRIGYGGSSRAGDPEWLTNIKVLAGAAVAWYSTDVYLGEMDGVEGLGYHAASVTVYPTGADGKTARRSGALIHSLAVWGV